MQQTPRRSAATSTEARVWPAGAAKRLGSARRTQQAGSESRRVQDAWGCPVLHLALARIRSRPLGGGLLLPERVRGRVQQRVVARLQPPVDAPHLRARAASRLHSGLAGGSEQPRRPLAGRPERLRALPCN